MLFPLDTLYFGGLTKKDSLIKLVFRFSKSWLSVEISVEHPVAIFLELFDKGCTKKKTVTLHFCLPSNIELRYLSEICIKAAPLGHE